MLKKSTILAFITFPFLLGSCGIYNKYTSPELTEKELLGENVTMKDSSIKELPSWNQVFTDGKLQALIDSALNSNSDLQTARLNILQSQKMLRTAKLSYLPTLSVEAEGKTKSFDHGSYQKSYLLPLTSSWEVDLFGRIRNRKEQVKSQVEQSEAYKKMIQTQLIANLAYNYYRLIMLDSQLELTKETAVIFMETLETVKSLKEVGLQNDAAVRQASANHKRVLITVEEIQKQIKYTENNICLLVNQTPRTIKRSALQDLDTKTNLNESISLLSLSNRPDVRFSELNLKESFYGVSYARSLLYPSLRLSGNLGWTNSNGGRITNPGDMLFSLIGSLTQPLFNAGKNRANLKIAKLEYDKRLIEFQKSLLIAGNEVNNALVEQESSNRKRELREDEISELAKAVEVARDLMIFGKVNYMEVLLSQNSLLSAKLLYSEDCFYSLVSKVNLYKALGGGV
jgi:NodT family efflux transporter outer membrane factor (OMF) lipoprotein